MIDYIPLDTVLLSIPKPIRDEQDDNTLLMYLFEGYRLVNTSHRYTNAVKIVEIVNHKADIPDGAKLINLVTYMKTSATKTQLQELCTTTASNPADAPCGLCGEFLECGCNGVYWTNDNNAYCSSCSGCVVELDDFATTTNNLCRHTLNYQLFLQSHFYNQNFYPLKYIGNKAEYCANDIVCNECMNRHCHTCNETFSINPSTKQFVVSLECGWLCVDYEEELKNADGQFLIPNEPELTRGLSLYAQAMHWLTRMSGKEQNTLQIYNTLLAQAEIAMRRAKGTLHAMQADDRVIRQIAGVETTNQMLLRMPMNYFKVNQNQ